MTTFIRQSVIVPIQELFNDTTNIFEQQLLRDLQSQNVRNVEFEQLIPVQFLLPMQLCEEDQKEIKKVETFFKICKLFTFFKLFNFK